MTNNNHDDSWTSQAAITRRQALRNLATGVGTLGLLGLPSMIGNEEWVKNLPSASLIIIGGGMDSTKKFAKVAEDLGIDRSTLVPEQLSRQLTEVQRKALIEAGDAAGIYKEIQRYSPFKGKTVVAVTSASEDNAEVNARYDAIYYSLLGAAKVVTITNREQADRKDIADIIDSKGTALVFFDGGKQETLTNNFVGTKAYAALLRRYLNDQSFTVAGSSAGAAVMSGNNNMIKSWNMEETQPVMGSGMVLLPNIIVDTHLHRNPELPRLPRLVQAVQQRRNCMGIGIDEGTGVVIRNGHATVIGNQKVWVVTPDHPVCDLEAHHKMEDRFATALPSFVRGQHFDLGKYAYINVPAEFIGAGKGQPPSVSHR